MNIVIENGRTDSSRISGNTFEERSGAGKVTTEQSNSQVQENRGVYALDISGKVMDNTAYIGQKTTGQGKTAEDVMQDAGQIDVATQKNFMTVMSNTMSAEDFAKLQEEGTSPGSTKIETVVTIVDEIKASLIKGGTNIAGYTDDMDRETLKEITGSEALANEMVKQLKKNDMPVTEDIVKEIMSACDTAMELDAPSDGAKKYMITNGMEPTIDNLYLAEHSAAADAGRQGRGYYEDGNGYYARKAEQFDWNKLQPQMEKVIENAGLSVSEETRKEAGWLMEKGMPLTEENLTALHELDQLKIPENTMQALPAAVAAASDGKNAKDADLYDTRTDIQKAQDYRKAFESVSGEAVDKAAAENKSLTLRSLTAAQSQLTAESAGVYEEKTDSRRLLEEVRLKMTVEANLHLMKKGISIDTEELSRLVAELDATQKEHNNMMYGSDAVSSAEERAGWYQDTLSRVSQFPGFPAAIVGRFAFSGRFAVQNAVTVTETAAVNEAALSGEFTLEGVYLTGSTLKSAYEKAGESYETLMTAPRADLGDSIKKAFRNVDDLLQERNLETSQENRRAVRILGYNEMELTEENIEAVKSTDLTIRRVTEKMTPASTMKMIREGVNPLSMRMEELEDYLDRQEKEPEQDLSKYSEYLYKMQQKNDITEPERDSYIGIYRLFRQLEKTDGAAIGALMGQEAVPTVGNLLSAMRSSKKRGMDVTVDDGFGGVTDSHKGKSISEQIDSAYAAGTAYQKKLAADIFDHLDGGKMTQGMTDENLTLEELAAMLRRAGNDEKADQDYIKQQASQIRQAGKTEEAVVKELLAFDQPVTADYLIAGGMLMKERGKLAERMKELASETGQEKTLEEAVSHLQESMGEKESAQSAYEELEETCNNILEHAVFEEDAGNLIDIRQISGLYKQISLAASLAKEENYEVPVEIDGKMTSINLKLIHNGEEDGKVTASMETEDLGKIMGQFHISAQMDGDYGLSGYIACDSKETADLMEQTMDGLKKVLKQSDIKINNLNVIHHEELDLIKATASETGKTTETADSKVSDKPVSSEKLYGTAKAFIGYIQKGVGK